MTEAVGVDDGFLRETARRTGERFGGRPATSFELITIPG